MKKVAVVTGASSGIGLAIAKKLQTLGYEAINFDIKAPAEGSLPFIACDVSDPQKVKAAFAEVGQKYGPLEVLVNNCGLQYMAPIDEYPFEKWQQLIGVMLTGSFLCTQNCWGGMKKNGRGRIINISSVHGKLASPYKSAYVAAKHGVLGLAKVAAIEGAPHNITVNTICPGFVDTPLMRDQIASQMKLNNLDEESVLKNIFLKDQHVKALTSVDQVAGFVEFLVGPNANTITGEAFNISGGWGMGL
jgi:3-hydroxybutyrate dehydrogenase